MLPTTTQMVQKMKPFTYLKEAVLPDIEAALGATHGSTLQEKGDSSIDSTTGALFRSADSSQDPVTRGQIWIQLSRLPSSENVRRETLRFLQEKFPIAARSITDVVADAWLDGVRMLVKRTQRQSAVSQFHRRRFQALAGSDLATIEQDLTSWSAFLHHDNPDRRCAAILQMASVRSRDDQCANRLMRIVRQDPDIKVLITATGALVKCCTDGSRPIVLTFLAGLVANASMPNFVREVAYDGLFKLDQKPVEEWPVMRQSLGDFVFPNDVDWQYVGSFATRASQ